ncbi:MAG TPA: TIM barrel protein, partial [Rhizomicrobium sp.]
RHYRGSMTGYSPALSLAHLSLIACPPDRLVTLAAEAGFGLVDLRLSPATPTDRIYGDDERMQLCRALQPLLRHTGVKVWDVEIIRINERTRPEDHLPLMEAAGLLGARRIKTVCDCEDPVLAAALLARLADLAAPFGLTIDLEYMVFSGVKSLRAALAIVEVAARPNLQVLVDALHWMRAGDTIADIRAAPPGRIGYTQLCDGPRQGPVGRDALIAEARTRRLPPGEGEFPLRALLDAMPPACPVSIEVPLQPGEDPSRHARRLFAAARRVTESQEATP